MNRFYLRGRYRENYLKRKFKKLGYLVLRCSVSRPVDLVLLKRGRCECGREIQLVRLIESKMERRKYIRPRQKTEFKEIERITGIKVEVV